MEELSFPWLSLPLEKRGEFMQALSKKFSVVHFWDYRRAEFRDIARQCELYTPHPSGIERQKPQMLIYGKNAPWLPVSINDDSLIQELMKLHLLFVKEDF